MKYTVSIVDFAKATHRSSMKHIYEQIRLGKIPAKKIDGKWLIAESALDAALKK